MCFINAVYSYQKIEWNELLQFFNKVFLVHFPKPFINDFFGLAYSQISLQSHSTYRSKLLKKECADEPIDKSKPKQHNLVRCENKRNFIW